VAAIRGVASGSFENYLADFEKIEYADPLLGGLEQKLVEAKRQIVDAIKYVKGKSTAYLDLSGRRIVDAAIAVIIGHLFLGQGARCDRKKRVARRFIESHLPIIGMNLQQVLSGDTSALDEYELLAGPVPSRD
jgi:hypothetical protein